MRLAAVILECFRSYRSRTRIELDDLTVLVGKNDVGKSTVLEALEIFFNSDLVKLEPDDCCVHTDSRLVRIGCAFTDLPEQIVVDEQVPTTLAGEFLLNGDGELEIHQVFDCSLKNPKPKLYAIAEHPTHEGYEDLLSLTITKLRSRAAGLGVDLTEVDQRISSELREAIWNSAGDLGLDTCEVSLDDSESKKVWAHLRKELPLFALFQSDRPSRDQDREVQDPMKVAVKEAIRGLEDQLETIKQEVQRKALEVADRTLEKLQDMDPALADRLTPQFSTEPKWDSQFKLTLEGDDGIAVNKRGSGVRRLILLNFFRAEAERRKGDEGASGIVFAIEEPETSQHPENQRALIAALGELSQELGAQVLLTTHVPALAGMVPSGALRFITAAADGEREVLAGGPDVLQRIAESLGVLPDPRGRIAVLVYVEGTNDIAFLEAVSETIADEDEEICSLGADDRIAFVPTGGSSLKAWVQGRYLEGLGLPGVHLYDRDDPHDPPYQTAVDAINAADDGSFAKLTDKRELENYLDHESIIEAYAEDGVTVTLDPVDDWDEVPERVAMALHNAASPISWDSLSDEKRRKKVSRAKSFLNSRASKKVTCERLRQRNGFAELRTWLEEVAVRCQ